MKRVFTINKMSMIYKALVIIGIFLMSSMTLQAQLLKKVGDAAKGAAENTTIRKTEQKTDDAVGKGIDKATDKNTYKGDKTDNDKSSSNNNNQSASGNYEDAPAQPAKAGNSKSLEESYAKSDFVAGDEIIFEDDLANEKMGEFPSQWDLLGGVAEVASIDKFKCIYFEGGTGHIAPLMKEKNYLPDVFTLEYDFWINEKKGITQGYTLRFKNTNDDEVLRVTLGVWDRDVTVKWSYKTPDGSNRDGAGTFPRVSTDSWYHFSLSFNKRALKMYINGVRVANVPNMAAPAKFDFWGNNWGTWETFKEAITNIRLAKGAVPLYDRMMSDGKIISYGITFDVGKSTIKPESMGEINRIVTLMKENPSLKFSVEGHTDNTGTAANNQTLSDARSKAVVDKLVELGINRDRLKSAGKGQTSPIADNKTDEGRAKNRRVEFVKIN